MSAPRTQVQPRPAQQQDTARIFGTRSAGALSIVSMLLAALPVAVLIYAGYQRRWVAEDAFISFRVVRHILAGHGPVFNLGERVEAYTHPLWVAILSVWTMIGLPIAHGAVILGLLFSAGGLIAAEAASLHVMRRCRPLSSSTHRTVTVPLGAIVFVAIPVVWDFVTSGLETGLMFGWLGLSYWLLVRDGLAVPAASRNTLATGFTLGLGPLIRPDMAVFSAGLLAALLSIHLPSAGRGAVPRLASTLLAAAAVPVAYQIFRMGYFATLVPSTALAKEASDANWSQGIVYLKDFVEVYHLWIPLVAVGGWWVTLLMRAGTERDAITAALLLAPVLAAALHSVYVVRVGGDFMHGRFLLPTLFGLLLPLMLVELPLPDMRVRPNWRLLAALPIAVVLAWSVVAPTLRVPYLGEITDTGLADERSVYTMAAHHSHPITLDDYSEMRWAREGQRWGERAQARERVLIILEHAYPLRASIDARFGVAALTWNVGLSGYAAGIETHIVDRRGLGDPVASRLRLTERGRPGHEKDLPDAWAIARFSSATLLEGTDVDPASVVAARQAIACGELREILAAVTEPLTAKRFLDNFRLSWSLHDLRISPDPIRARDELCGR